MSDLDKILLTSSLTICGGVIVLVIGQVLMKLLIEPLFALRSLIGDIADNLFFYGHVYSNPGAASDELKKESKEVLRQKASLLRARAHILPLYTLFSWIRLVPTRKSITQASEKLIGLSNGILDGDPLENHRRQEAIRLALNLPN